MALSDRLIAILARRNPAIWEILGVGPQGREERRHPQPLGRFVEVECKGHNVLLSFQLLNNVVDPAGHLASLGGSQRTTMGPHEQGREAR